MMEILPLFYLHIFFDYVNDYFKLTCDLCFSFREKHTVP
jgi:hypothetical protein